MGGHLSCMHVAASSVNRENCTSGVLKVVLACEGRTCEFSEPLKVAELMLEFPNHFVTEYEMTTEKLVRGESSSAGAAGPPGYTKRVSPLPADHDAKLCHVYLLLPMHRLNTRLSADEIALVSALAAAPSPSSTAPLQCTTLKTSKVTPLSARHYQEAAATATTSSSSDVAIAKSYSVPILELSEEDTSMEDSQAHNASQQHLHILRSKSWTPKLETIIESYL